MQAIEVKSKQEKRPLYLIQVLRGVAALLVVADHGTHLAVERLGLHIRTWDNGGFGVDIFFVISGLVMALSSRSLAGKAWPAIEFMKRRLERIVPLYWIFTTLKLALMLAVPSVVRHGVGSAWHIIASYLFIPSYDSAGGPVPLLIVGWTLNFEMFFYVLFALALGLKVRPLRLLIPVLSLMALVPVFVPNPHWAVLSWCNPLVLDFLYGILLYEAYQRRLKLPMWLTWSAAATGVGVMLFTPWAGESLLHPFVWGIPALAVVSAAIQLEGQLGEKAPKWMLDIGDASYSIYLSHSFVLPVLGVLLLRLHVQSGLIVLLCSLIVSTLVGWLIYQFVEQPFIRYFHVRRLINVAVPA